MKIRMGDLVFEAEIRWVEDLKPVLAYPEEIGKNFPAYYMFRDVYKEKGDKEKIAEHGVRYDITYIPPAKIGKEFVKTYGHYHPKANSVSYPEVYEVLEGKAIYLLQKDIEVSRVVAVFAEKGDKVIIPPDYGHVTINPEDKPLKMANWVSRNFKSIYEPYTERRGACYYYTTDGWLKNEKYEQIPELEIAKCDFEDVLGLSKDEEMYSLVDDLKKLDFLNNPDKYAEKLEKTLRVD